MINSMKDGMQDEDKEAVGAISDSVDNVASDVRSISHQMMPRAIGELGLVLAIADMLDKSLSLSDIKHYFEHFKVEGKRYEKRIELATYRICQELINNIIKHSNASEAAVQLLENRGHIVMIVEDNGKEFDMDQQKDGIGLMNIPSRLNTINGEANWDPSAGSGTAATV